MKPKFLLACGVTAVLVGVLCAGRAQAQDQAESVKRGAQAYRICAACHSLQPDVHLSGPSLADRWGKEAGTIPGFGRYTEVLKKSGIVWEEAALDGWIADPQAMLPGTTMTFRGVPDLETRKNLIAFLREALSTGGTDRMVKSGILTENMAAGPVSDDVSNVGDNQRIKAIRHCGDGYYVTTADGAQFPFWETNVRIKIDTSPRGPKKGVPVLVRSGMVGDRVSVVFSSIAELNQLLADKC
jgi:cytochrome c